MIKFDHIEVHVSNSKKYALFLEKLFIRGRYKKISESVQTEKILICKN